LLAAVEPIAAALSPSRIPATKDSIQVLRGNATAIVFHLKDGAITSGEGANMDPRAGHAINRLTRVGNYINDHLH
jgi:hypothetical protein